MFGNSPIPALILFYGCGFCLTLKTNLNPIKIYCQDGQVSTGTHPESTQDFRYCHHLGIARSRAAHFLDLCLENDDDTVLVLLTY